jgi:hypothetical protein
MDYIKKEPINYIFCRVWANCVGKLDPKTFVKKIELDVTTNKEKTQVLQGSNIVSKSFDICTTRPREKIYNPSGYINVSLAENKDLRYYTYPTDILPIGTYCTYCKKIGPKMHNFSCKKPVLSSLNLTLKGLMECLYTGSGSFKFDPELDDVIEDLGDLDIKKYLKDQSGVIPKKIIKTLLHKDNHQLTMIPYSDIKKIKIQKEFWKGSIMLEYKTKNGAGVSIQIRSNKNITTIGTQANPWAQKDTLYKDIIDKINETLTSYKARPLKIINSEVTSAMCTIVFLKQGYTKSLNTNKIYDYFWPTNENGSPVEREPRIIYEELDDQNNVVVKDSFIEYKDQLYKYTYKVAEKNQTRKILELYSCEEVEDEDESRIIVGPYKFTVQFYKDRAQVSFSYCDKKKKKCDIYKPDDLNIKTSSENIVNEIEKLQDMFVYYINKLIKQEIDEAYNKNKEPDIFINEEISENNFTILGKIPDVKLKFLNKGVGTEKNLNFAKPSVIGEKVELFDTDNMVWLENEGTIIGPKKSNKSTNYNVIVKINGIEKSVPYTLLRFSKKKGSRTQPICRPENRPIPFSFYGECPEGLTQYINPIGVQSRVDNRYYPCCSNITNRTLHNESFKRFLLEGFTNDERIMGNITEKTRDLQIKNLQDGLPIDDFAGTLKKSFNGKPVTNVGSTVLVNKDGLWVSVTIMNAKSTWKKGSDNKMIYIVRENSEDGEEFVISGEDFHPKYREIRNFRGLKNVFVKEKDQVDFLLDCAEELGIVRPVAIFKEIHDKKMINKYKKYLTENNFTGINIENLTKKPYLSAFIPKNSVLSILSSNSKGCYLVDSLDRIMTVKCNIKDPKDVIKGYLSKNGDFYPIDLISDKSKIYKSRLTKLDSLLKKIRFGSKKNELKGFLNIKTDLSYIGPHRSGLISFVNNFIDNKGSGFNYDNSKSSISSNSLNYDIVFIPTEQSSSKILKWSESHNLSVVLQLVSKKSDDLWKLGVNGPKSDTLNLVNKSLDFYVNFKKLNINTKKLVVGDYLHVKLNIVNEILNKNNPILDPTKVTQGSYPGTEETEDIISNIMYKIDKNMFDDHVWKVASRGFILKDSGIDKPLVIE